MDANALKSGEDVGKLRDTYVILLMVSRNHVVMSKSPISMICARMRI